MGLSFEPLPEKLTLDFSAEKAWAGFQGFSVSKTTVFDVRIRHLNWAILQAGYTELLVSKCFPQIVNKTTQNLAYPFNDRLIRRYGALE